MKYYNDLVGSKTSIKDHVYERSYDPGQIFVDSFRESVDLKLSRMIDLLEQAVTLLTEIEKPR